MSIVIKKKFYGTPPKLRSTFVDEFGNIYSVTNVTPNVLYGCLIDPPYNKKLDNIVEYTCNYEVYNYNLIRSYSPSELTSIRESLIKLLTDIGVVFESVRFRYPLTESTNTTQQNTYFIVEGSKLNYRLLFKYEDLFVEFRSSSNLKSFLYSDNYEESSNKKEFIINYFNDLFVDNKFVDANDALLLIHPCLFSNKTFHTQEHIDEFYNVLLATFPMKEKLPARKLFFQILKDSLEAYSEGLSSEYKIMEIE